MNLTYVVLLKPSEIRFTKNVIASKFDNGIPLLETFTQIKNGEILLEDIPLIEVVFYSEKWEWYTRNNRRLWVFKELEKVGKCNYIKTKRFEYVENVLDYPSLLYGSAALAENSRSFTWRGNELQITARRTPSKEIEVVYDKDEERARSERRGEHESRGRAGFRADEQEQNKQQRSGYKWRRKVFCPRRYHPYTRYESHEERREARVVSSDGRQRLEITSWRRRNSESSDCSSMYGFQFSYTVWYQKRQSFLQRVFCIRTGRLRDPTRFLEVLYTCGVCFKSFKSKVSLNQHSEDLGHWACVRCGRFFGSHTALGQHKLALQHTI